MHECSPGPESRYRLWCEYHDCAWGYYFRRIPDPVPYGRRLSGFQLRRPALPQHGHWSRHLLEGFSGGLPGPGFNFRPVLWNINYVYSPKLASHAYLELDGGIGALSTRYYTGQVCGIYTCSNYQSSNHFDVDLGGGIKLYATHGFFVRPEARYYFVNNNTDFSSNHFGRYGLSIGYTFH